MYKKNKMGGCAEGVLGYEEKKNQKSAEKEKRSTAHGNTIITRGRAYPLDAKRLAKRPLIASKRRTLTEGEAGRDAFLWSTRRQPIDAREGRIACVFLFCSHETALPRH